MSLKEHFKRKTGEHRLIREREKDPRLFNLKDNQLLPPENQQESSEWDVLVMIIGFAILMTSILYTMGANL